RPGLPLADGSRGLYRRAGAARRVPGHGARRQRPAAHRHPLRRPRPLPRAQAPLPPDLQQGSVSRPQLHDPVREGEGRARGDAPDGGDVRRRRAAHPRRRQAARGAGRRERGGARPPHALALRLGRRGALDPQDEQGARRVRGFAVLGVRRGDRRARPAALCGVLEIAIDLFGIVSPAVLGLARHAYVGAAAALGAGSLGSLALRFGLAALVLLVPTTLMGGTLPVLTRALTGTD